MIINNQIGESDLNKNKISELYKDALYQHLIGQGYSEFEAEVLLHKYIQKPVSIQNERSRHPIDERLEDEYPTIVQMDENTIKDDAVFIQVDEKTMEKVLKRKIYEI